MTLFGNRETGALRIAPNHERKIEDFRFDNLAHQVGPDRSGTDNGNRRTCSFHFTPPESEQVTRRFTVTGDNIAGMMITHFASRICQHL
ncbi:hypothetical protein LMG29542_05971 [Paraburkholderia humisilvae]|uniref:Uncharacterized protein n=1 Tax=Paraburkholderia humisilvae TaxID=627669 RepID=A0A6J5ESH6_9BURK|nr:hypothetical protein LMG29542_05971 [Paraburkholderia humisilvae]